MPSQRFAALAIAGKSTFTAALLLSTVGCLTVEDVSGDPAILLDEHAFPLPPSNDAFVFPVSPTVEDRQSVIDAEIETQIGSGYVTGVALEQPIQFPHYTHAQVLGMECQYCHSEARKSKHSGIPPLQSCMGCHKWVKTDQPEIKKLTAIWNEAKGDTHMKSAYSASMSDEDKKVVSQGQVDSIEWNKVHDIPDFVHFAHKPHIRAGVNCTECHGQMQLQGMKENVMVGVNHTTGENEYEEAVVNVVIRETTMQMGWCLDCHASHPSVDANYGDKANLRRAELKDCWTCHK
ncbi:MAG: cytochrome c3 family protein [Myxococcota bacterium]